jgi:hypothetical protein
VFSLLLSQHSAPPLLRELQCSRQATIKRRAGIKEDGGRMYTLLLSQHSMPPLLR